MNGIRWMIVLLAVLNAGWVLFDGSRALVKGDYVTQTTGEHAGQLGPWSKVVESIGIEPRSTTMKLIFVFYGVGMLVITGCFAQKLPWAWRGMLVAAILGLWYLPIGTILNTVTLVLLFLPSLRKD